MGYTRNERFEHRVGGFGKNGYNWCGFLRSSKSRKNGLFEKTKVENMAKFYPEQKVEGSEDADILVIGWGSTYGHIKTTVEELRKEERKLHMLILIILILCHAILMIY